MNVTIVIFVLVAVNVAGYALVYLALRSRLARTTSAREQIGEIADEVNRLVVDLNQTTDRNIALIEDRIRQLSDMLARADKKMSLFKKESERHDAGAQIYSRIREPKVPSAEASGEVPSGAAPETPDTGETHATAHALPTRDQIVSLYRAGFSASLIASRVGVPLGEVELTIALEQRKGSA